MNLSIRDTIGIYPNAVPDDVCDKVIECFHKAKETGETWDGYVGGGVNNDAKKSRDWSLQFSQLPEAQEVFKKIHQIYLDYLIPIYTNGFPHQEKIQGDYLFKCASTYYELVQVAHYEKNIGHYNGWHCEHGDWNFCKRLFIQLIYLNDVLEGGETEFLYADLKVKPKKGTLVIHPAGFPYFHKAHVPKSNDKYIIVGVLSYWPPNGIH